MNETNETLKRALAMARDRPREALELLASSLERARRDGDDRSIALLARHAGLVSSASGELRGALAFFLEAVRVDPDDAYLHFALGDTHRLLGESGRARDAFAESLRLANAQGDADMIEMATCAATTAQGGLDPRPNGAKS